MKILLSHSHDGVALRSVAAPDAITSDIATTPSRYPTLFSRESWEQYCVAKHGTHASLLARGLFGHLANLDGRDDGVLDIHGLNLDSISAVFGFGDVDAVFDKFEGPFKDAIRADLDQLHHSSAMRPHRGELFVTKVGENRFFAVAGNTEHTYTITSSALNAAWDKAMRLHPETPWIRVVTHNGYHTGRTNNPADPDRQMANIAIMQADLLVTGGVGAVASDTEMLIAPSGSLNNYIDPYTIDLAINAIVGLTYLLAAIAGKGRASVSAPPMSGSGSESPYKKPTLGYPRAVVSQLVARLRRAQESGQRLVTAYMGNAPRPAPQQAYVELGVDLVPGVRRLVKVISGAFARVTDRDVTRTPELPTQPAVVIDIGATFQEGFARISGIKDVKVHNADSMIYISGSAGANQVNVRLPAMTTLDAARLVLRHITPILTHRVPVPLNVTVIFEPDVAFESLCRMHGFSRTATERAMAGGIVKIHMDGHGVKKVDFTADDAAVLSINRITGGDLIDKNTLKVELTLPRSIVQNPTELHQRFNAVKDQLLSALWRIDKTRVPEFIPPFQPLDL